MPLISPIRVFLGKYLYFISSSCSYINNVELYLPLFHPIYFAKITSFYHHHRNQIASRPFEKRHIQLIGHISAGRDAIDGSGRVCLVTGYTSGLSGAVPPGFNPLRSQRHFCKCRARVGYGPAPQSTLKRPCAILVR